MILIEAGRRDARSFDARVMFAALLARHGYDVGIDEDTLPDTIARVQRYDLAPFATPSDDRPIDAIIVIGADEVSQETILTLRGYSLGDMPRVAALGHFPNSQALISTETRLAHATGRDATVVDLTRDAPGLIPGSYMPFFAPDVSPRAPDADDDHMPVLAVSIGSEELEDPQTLPLLAAMSNMASFRLIVLTTGKEKDQIKSSRYASLEVFTNWELPPDAMAERTDVLAVFGETPPSERVGAIAIHMLAAGGAVVDCTNTAHMAATGAPVLRGSPALAALPGYLDLNVLQNLAEIARTAAEDPWFARHSLTRLESVLGLERPEAAPPRPASPRVVFFPTNGNGLGHAQRTSQIARALPEGTDVQFHAFPSCLPLINAKGFPAAPLVSASSEHAVDNANDILNALRLERSVRKGDHVVFDGGYVFESIFRAIMCNGLNATWVRRGLWRPGQISDSHLEREKAFNQVIVPSEAFDELNTEFSFGPHIHKVGPVVPSDAPETPAEDIREELARTLGVEFDMLVVSMLGGGVAADRTAQLQAISAALAPRTDCLHVTIAWPGSLAPRARFGWPNTRFVSTLSALPLARAADMVISAAGYNAFHELLYNRVPTVFIPQIAPYMDDQERRARAASDRNVATTVMADEMILLSREISAFLDQGKGATMRAELALLDLPEPGTAAAAQLIAEAMA